MTITAYSLALTLAKASGGDSVVDYSDSKSQIAEFQLSNPRKLRDVLVRQGFRSRSALLLYKVSPTRDACVTVRVPEGSGRVSYPAGPDNVVRVFVTKTISEDPQFRRLDVSFYHALISAAVFEIEGTEAFYPEVEYFDGKLKRSLSASEQRTRAILLKKPYRFKDAVAASKRGGSERYAASLGVSEEDLRFLASDIGAVVSDDLYRN